MDNVIVYHGARGRLSGDIAPKSRSRSDFGAAFYMHQDPELAKIVIANDPTPVLYKLEFMLSEIPDKKVLKLKGEDWLYAVLTFRGDFEVLDKMGISGEKAIEEWNEKFSNYDIIMGKTTDVRLLAGLSAYENEEITKEGLLEYLEETECGMQFAAKTELACSLIKKLEFRELTNREREESLYYDKDLHDSYRRAISKMKDKELEKSE